MTSREPSPEMHLLDDLLCCSHPFSTALLIFQGDVERLLTSLRHMRSDGIVFVRKDGIPVEDWQLAKWKNEIECSVSIDELSNLVIDITEKGIDFFYPRKV